MEKTDAHQFRFDSNFHFISRQGHQIRRYYRSILFPRCCDAMMTSEATRRKKKLERKRIACIASRRLKIHFHLSYLPNPNLSSLNSDSRRDLIDYVIHLSSPKSQRGAPSLPNPLFFSYSDTSNVYQVVQSPAVPVAEAAAAPASQIDQVATSTSVFLRWRLKFTQ